MVSVPLLFTGLLLAAVGFLNVTRPETMLYVRNWPSLRRDEIEMTDSGRIIWIVLGAVFGGLGLGIVALGLVS